MVPHVAGVHPGPRILGELGGVFKVRLLRQLSGVFDVCVLSRLSDVYMCGVVRKKRQGRARRLVLT